MRKALTVLALFTAFLVAAPLVAHAQTGALVSMRVQFLQNGAVLPTQFMTITLSAATCGVVPKFPVPPSVFISVSGRVVWDDPANPSTADCFALQTTGGTLVSLPLGNNYTATSTFTDDFASTSLPSLPSNSFTRGVRPLPSAPTGVRVLQ